MTKLISAALAVGIIAVLAPISATAQDVTQEICGFVADVHPSLALLNIEVGLPFAATVTTNDADKDQTVPYAACDSAGDVGDNCGTLASETRGVAVNGYLISVQTSPTSWAASANTGLFEVDPENPGTLVDADIDTFLVSPQDGGGATNPRLDPSSIHPSFSQGAIQGYANVDIDLTPAVPGDGKFYLDAEIRWVGSYNPNAVNACAWVVPTLPVWGFPLLGIGMLASAGMMLRKRA